MPRLLGDADRGIVEADFASRSTAIALAIVFRIFVALLANMSIKQSPASGQQAIRHVSKYRTGNFELPLVAARSALARQPPIRQLCALRAPTVLEGNQSRVIGI